MKLFLKKYFYEILLALLIIGLLISHSLYIWQTKQYPEMDEQHYMYMAVGFYRLLQHPTFFTPIQMIEYLPFRQPGYSFIILPFILLFGITHSYTIALWVNGLLYSVTIIGIYFLGREFFNKKISLLSSFIFTCFGWSLFYLHFTYSETATTCFVVLSLLFLKKSNFFKNRKYTFLFAFAFGYGTFVRWVTPIFVAGPFLLTLYLALKQKKRKALGNLLLSTLFFLPALIPYFINAGSFFGSYIRFQLFKGQLWNLVPAERHSFISFQSAVYYLKVFEQLSFFSYALFLIGLGICIWKYKKWVFLLLAFIFPYLAFSFATIIKDDRYIVPIYPVIALVSVVVFESIKNKKIKLLLTACVISISLFNFFGASWGIGPMKVGGQSILLRMPIGHARRIHIAPIVWPPTKEFTNAESLMNVLDSETKRRNLKNTNIILLFSYHPVDNAIYAINTFETKNPMHFQNYVGDTGGTPAEIKAAVSSSFGTSQFILVKDKNPIDNYFPSNNYWLLTKILKAFDDPSNNLKQYLIELAKIYIPKDKSIIIIYAADKIPADKISHFADLVANFSGQTN